MPTNVIWTGDIYHSIEHCLITKSVTGNEINSTIIGHYEGKIFKVEYQIKTNERWQTKLAMVRTQLDNATNVVTLQQKQGKVVLDGKDKVEFSGIFDVDISLTPFSNTLPINRLKLDDNERRVIDVLYFDVLEKETKLVKQIYTRITEDHYIYENHEGNFKADLQIDKQGFVTDYPGLFKMSIKLTTDND